MNNPDSTFTFRVENIPPGSTAEELKKRFHAADQPNIEVRSFVPAIDNPENEIHEYTATISFQITDRAVSSPRPLDNDDIIIDSDFYGFTPLNNPSGPIAAE